jgi:hypothetical protein
MTLKQYKLYNTVMAWGVFLIALITYGLTVEPTVSLWDCGEFISSAYKLEVGHPPGAPLYMLLGRFFSIFAPSPEKVALMINYVSVLASAFTILFLFWSITYFAKKLLVTNNQFDKGSVFAIFASGVTGALAYTFSDSFWFSAVEAEVYALSSLFTAIVFWSVLKWEEVSAEKYANRWLIFIAFMMGLSIGVHLLNLLAIPAIVFIYYYKNYKVDFYGIVKAFIISILILAIVMYVIIQGYVLIASKFELLFVNQFGLPFKSGLFFFILLTIGLLVFGIYKTYKKNKVLMNTIYTAVLVILIGYSSFAVIMIRSAANPPMDENNPENVFSLLSYLNREQYGSRPLFYGQYYDAEFERNTDGSIKSKPVYTYIPDNGDYLRIKKTNPKYLYEDERETIFPRMYSRDENHVSAYQNWGQVEQGESPSFGNNLRFFVSYQLGSMYFRYFLWNFSGRQNGEQSFGGIMNGNAVTGVNFIDEIMLGSQDNLPSHFKNDKSRNVYYMLPLLLGLIGLLFSFQKDQKNASVILLLFFFTGIAIVFYLNQTPYQPRERDYAYAGSFYAFSIWIGLGITGIYHFFQQRTKKTIALVLTVMLAIPVPTIMAADNWDDHDRSGKYTGRDAAKYYLDSCEKNAILFTYGDNDTFPLWYVQEVEGYRTDIKIVNLSLLGTDWYIDQMRMQTYDAKAVPFKMNSKLYREGVRDAIYVTENPELYIDDKYLGNEIKYKAQFASLKELMLSILQSSDYPTLNSKDFETVKTALPGITPVKFSQIAANLSEPDFTVKYRINEEKSKYLYTKAGEFLKAISDEHLPLNLAMDFVGSDKKESKLPAGSGESIVYLPSKKLSLTVPWPSVARSSTFTAEELAKFEKNIKWTIPGSYLFKNDIAVLEIIARNNWERPIYFATSVPTQSMLGLNKYFRLEGFAYRLVPYKTDGAEAYINTDILYENLMHKFDWESMTAKNVYFGTFDLRNFRILAIRETFAKLADKLIVEGKNKKAEEVLDKCIQIMPDEKVPYDMSLFEIIRNYYKIGQNEKAGKIIDLLASRYKEEFIYLSGKEGMFSQQVAGDYYELVDNVSRLIKLTEEFKQPDRKGVLEKVMAF